jgi:hypothetical protein
VQRKAMMPEFDTRGDVRFFDLEQVTLAPDIMAFPLDELTRRFAFLLLKFLLLAFYPSDFGNRETRIVSRFIRVGAAIRTEPLGGLTLKWTFLMSLNVTTTLMPAISNCSAINIPTAPLRREKCVRPLRRFAERQRERF